MKKMCTLVVVLTLFGVFAANAAAARLFTGAKSKIDAVSADSGYITVTCTATLNKKIKVQITKGGSTHTYDLFGEKPTRYPLQVGNGTYSCTVLENIQGNEYAIIQTAEFTAAMSNPNAPFLVSSQIVDYTNTSKPVIDGINAVTNAKTVFEKVDRVYNLVAQRMSYDYDKAKTVQGGYVPSIDTVWSSRKGICYDYAAVMASILRSQGIPTKVVMGYVKGNAYHAWVEVYIDKVGWVATGPIQFDGKKFSLMDPTFLSTAGVETATNYIGDGSNYRKTDEF